MSEPSTPNQGLLGRMFGSISRLVATPTNVSQENQAPQSNIAPFFSSGFDQATAKIHETSNVVTPRANSTGRHILNPRKPRRWGDESPPHTPVQTNGRAVLAPRQPRVVPQSEPRNKRQMRERSDSPPHAPGQWPKSDEQATPAQLPTAKPRRIPATERRRRTNWTQQAPKTPLQEAQENFLKWQELMKVPTPPTPPPYRPVHSVKNFDGDMPPSAMKNKRTASPMRFTSSKKVKFTEFTELKLISPTQLNERTHAEPSPRKRQRASADYDGGEFDDPRPSKRLNMFGKPQLDLHAHESLPKPENSPNPATSTDSQSSLSGSVISSTTKANTVRNRFISPAQSATASSSLTPHPSDFEPSREHPAPGMFCVPDYSDDELSMLSNGDPSMPEASSLMSNQSPAPSVASHIVTPGILPPAQATNLFKVPDYSMSDSSGRDPTPTPGPVSASAKPSSAPALFDQPSNTPKSTTSNLSTPKPSTSQAFTSTSSTLKPNIFGTSASASASTSSTPRPPLLKPALKATSASTNSTSSPFPALPAFSPTTALARITPTIPASATALSTTPNPSHSSGSLTLTETTSTYTFPTPAPQAALPSASPTVLAALNARTSLDPDEEAAFASHAWAYGFGRYLQGKEMAEEMGRELVVLL